MTYVSRFFFFFFVLIFGYSLPCLGPLLGPHCRRSVGGVAALCLFVLILTGEALLAVWCGTSAKGHRDMPLVAAVWSFCWAFGGVLFEG